MNCPWRLQNKNHMALHQQKFREIVLQLLYGLDLAEQSPEELQKLLSEELEVSKSSVRLAQTRVDQIIKVLNILDDLIRKTSLSYQFERIPTVERNILRLGVFELVYDDSIPPKVAITEAMRLARKFSSPESASFVNALMDTLYKQQQGETVDQKSINETAQTMQDEIEKTQELIDRAHLDE